ncbi:hypothetical protein AMECASPLE_000325 [Ameca splendens]|uniref:Uncharacterized protein n=1 Tax=Ameca splendens TaxID=208324 RepID=A0ABV0ZVP0_9TELE
MLTQFVLCKGLKYTLSCPSGDEGCHVEPLEEQCVEEHHEVDQQEAAHPEAPLLVGVGHPLLLLEEGLLPAPGHLQLVLQGCSLLQHCLIKQDLQDHSPKLMLMMNMVHMRSLMQSLPTRDMIAITVSSMLLRILNTMIMDTVKPRIHHMRAMVKVTGTIRGPTLALEAKLP